MNNKILFRILWLTIWWWLGISYNVSLAGCDNTTPSDRIWDNLNVNVSNIEVCTRSWSCNSYNLNTDLWLPNLKNFSKLKDWVFENWSLYWPWSFYKSNTSGYPLYTSNGEKWGICKPYYLTWHCWNGDDYSSNARSVSRFWKIASWGDDFGLLFWIPFSYINGEVVNKLNIVTDIWHINWTLNESDVEFNFSFY